MSFWETSKIDEGNRLKVLIDSVDEDHSLDVLDQLLDDDLIFQELRSDAQHLNEYFTRDIVLDELLKRSLYFEPDPQVDPTLQFRQSPRALAIMTTQVNPHSQVQTKILERPDIVKRLVNFLDEKENPNASEITASFYKRLIFSLVHYRVDSSIDSDNEDSYAEECFPMLGALIKSQFLTHCLNSLKFSAVAELVARLPLTVPDPDYQFRAFAWFSEVRLPLQLMKLFQKSASDRVLLGVSFICAEFDDMQLFRLETGGAFPLEYFSGPTLCALLENIMPSCEKACPRLISFAGPVLVSFLEVNRSPYEPGTRINPQMYTRMPSFECNDPSHILETIISRNATLIVRLALTYLVNSEANDEFMPAAVWLLKVLRTLTNSNHMATHYNLGCVFSSPVTSIFKLLQYACDHPLSSVANAHILSIVGHAIYANTEVEHPMIDALFLSSSESGLSILAFIEAALNVKSAVNAHGDKLIRTMEDTARKAFFLKLGEHINHAAEDDCPRGEYLSKIMHGSACYDSWSDLTNTTIHSFTESNKTYSVNSSFQDRSCFEVDEMDRFSSAPLDEVTDETRMIRLQLDHLVRPCSPNKLKSQKSPNLNGNGDDAEPKPGTSATAVAVVITKEPIQILNEVPKTSSANGEEVEKSADDETKILTVDAGSESDVPKNSQ